MVIVRCDSEAMAGERLKLSRDFYDDKWSKHRIITSLDWSSQVCFTSQPLKEYITEVCHNAAMHIQTRLIATFMRCTQNSRR